MKEIWKDVKGYEGFYIISNLGNIKSVDREIKGGKRCLQTRKLKSKQIKPYQNKKNGYLYAHICKNGIEKNIRLHRLVAINFIPNPLNLQQVNHIDGNKQNNRVDNLEWCTGSENVTHAYRNGLTKHFTKKVNKLSKNNEILQTYNSILEASQSVNGFWSNIIKCCKGEIDSAYGFKWEYVD